MPRPVPFHGARWKDWWSWPGGWLRIVHQTVSPQRHVGYNGPSFAIETSFFYHLYQINNSPYPMPAVTIVSCFLSDIIHNIDFHEQI